MEMTTLGDSGVVVSRLGLGLAALGRPAYINVGHGEDLEGRRTVAGLREHAHGVLDAALAAGVTYLDAARSYGKAESFLADWLADRGISVGTVTVGSKWGYTYTADWAMDAEVHEVKEHSRENLDRQITESRSLLGRHLRVYQIHSATRREWRARQPRRPRPARRAPRWRPRRRPQHERARSGRHDPESRRYRAGRLPTLRERPGDLEPPRTVGGIRPSPTFTSPAWA